MFYFSFISHVRAAIFFNMLKTLKKTLKRWNNLFQGFISVLFHIVKLV